MRQGDKAALIAIVIFPRGYTGFKLYYKGSRVYMSESFPYPVDSLDKAREKAKELGFSHWRWLDVRFDDAKRL